MHLSSRIWTSLPSDPINPLASSKINNQHTNMEEQSQQQQAFTFASPISSAETYEDALDFDYQSWIEQSKINNRSSSQGDKLWMEHAEAINKFHREMLFRDLPEEAYEMSLRDLSELSLSKAATEETTNRPVRSNSNKKPQRKKTPFRERAGLIIKLFMLPPPRAAAATIPERKKSFSSSTMTTSVNGGSVQKSISEAGSETSNTQGNSMPIKSYQDSSNRASMVCYPLFNSRKYKVKRVASGHFSP